MRDTPEGHSIDVETDSNAEWIDRWLHAVADGTARMSQRSRAAIDQHGGIEEVIAAARAKNVHLLSLTDDRGKCIVAASRHPFVTLC